MSEGKNEVLRFAFGTPDRPGSSVWRISNVSRGDIYINNCAPLASQVHLALHASGVFSYKLGTNKRHALLPPMRDPTGTIHGPCIFFSADETNLKPPDATGSIDKVQWLGWPNKDSLISVRTYYCEEGWSLRLAENEVMVGKPLSARLFNETAKFYAVAEYREMLPEEAQGLIPYNDHRRIEFPDALPPNMELIKIAKTPQGVSAVVIEGFEAVLKPSQ